ncbi:MAG: DUF839 domain-containing protein, partial [Gammaproteobacteria bacterium]|nr:DUF839 domain-containing protein [Gammaproteobacteria bacterium]
MNFDYDDQASNPNYDRDSFTQICERRLSRRGFFQGTAAVAVGALAGCDLRSEPEAPAAGVADVKGAFDFIEIEHGVTQDHEVAEPHRAEVLLRWGDALFEDSPEFDYRQQTAASQSRQFGFNNDYVGFRPLPLEAGQQNRGLLCVNHEYPSVAMMFADIGRDVLAETTARHVEVGQAAVGASVVEVVMRDGQWRV